MRDEQVVRGHESGPSSFDDSESVQPHAALVGRARDIVGEKLTGVERRERLHLDPEDTRVVRKRGDEALDSGAGLVHPIVARLLARRGVMQTDVQHESGGERRALRTISREGSDGVWWQSGGQHLRVGESRWATTYRGPLRPLPSETRA